MRRVENVPAARFLVVVLIAALINALTAQSVSATSFTPGEDRWETIATLPPGAELRLTFRDGTSVTGTLVRADADSVLLKDNRPGPGGLRTQPGARLEDAMTFQRTDVETVRVTRTKPAYIASGQPDADSVRRAVMALGVGKKVEVRTTAAMRIRGRIRSIEADRFRVVRGGALGSTEIIEFASVASIKGTGLDRSTALLIGAGIAVTVIILLARPWVPS